MTVRNVVLKTGAGPDSPVTPGEIKIRRRVPGATDDGTFIHATDTLVSLTSPAPSVPLKVGEYYWFTPVRPAGKPILALVPAGAGDLLFKDLVPVDPSSLAPSAEPGPAWFTDLPTLIALPGTPSNPLTNGSATRPAMPVVYWRTSTAPTNAINGDHWEQI